MFLHVWLQVLPQLACSWSQGRAAGGEEGSACLLQAPCSRAGGLRCCRFFSAMSQPFACRVGPFPGDPWWRSRLQMCFFSFRGAGSNPASCHPWVRLSARDLWFGLAKYAPLVKIAPVRWIGRWESYRTKLICELINAVMNLVLFWALGCLGEGESAWLGSVSPQDEISLSVTLTRLPHVL